MGSSGDRLWTWVLDTLLAVRSHIGDSSDNRLIDTPGSPRSLGQATVRTPHWQPFHYTSSLAYVASKVNAPSEFLSSSSLFKPDMRF